MSVRTNWGALLALTVALQASADPCEEVQSLTAELRGLRSRPRSPADAAREQDLNARVTEANVRCEEARCMQGNAEACSNAAGSLARKGEHARARELVKRACVLGRKLSCEAAHATEGIHEQLADIRVTAARRCDEGRGADCVMLGNLDFRDGDWNAARKRYGQGCDAGTAKGCANAAVVEAKQKRFKEAEGLLEKACRGGMKPACHTQPGVLEMPW